MCSFDDTALAVSWKVGSPYTGLTIPVGTRPKSVRNRCVIEVFGGVCVLSFGFRIFCWYMGFCHRTGSDLVFLFVYLSKFLSYHLTSCTGSAFAVHNIGQ